jgi:hypothetical protein
MIVAKYANIAETVSVLIVGVIGIVAGVFDNHLNLTALRR